METPLTCPFCHEVKKTAAGVRSHITQKESCHRAFQASVQRHSQLHLDGDSDMLNHGRAPENALREAGDAFGTLAADEEAGVGMEQWDAADPPRHDEAVMEIPQDSVVHTRPEGCEPQSKRARVEDVEDEDAGGLPRRPWVEDFPGAGKTYGQGETLFESMFKAQERAGASQWDPFDSEEEWRLAHWLLTSGLTQKGIDEYLNLEIVRTYHHCSSLTAAKLSTMIRLASAPICPSRINTSSSKRWTSYHGAPNGNASSWMPLAMR